MSTKQSFVKQIKEYKGRSFFVRNLLIVVVLAMLPVMLTSIVFYRNTSDSISGEISRNNDNYLQTVAAILDNTVRESELFAIQTAIHDDVSSLVFASAEDEKMLNIQQFVKDYIKNYIYIYDYIHSVYVYTEKSNLIIENQVTMHYDDHEDKDWYHYYRNTPTKKSTVVLRKWRGRYPYVISVIRPIGDEYGKLGCVVVNLDISKIILSTRRVVKEAENLLLLADESNRVLYSESGQSVYLNMNIDTMQKGNAIHIDGDKYLVSKRSSGLYDWNYILLSSNSYYEEFARGQISYAVVIVLLLFFAVIISSFVISLYSYRPIRRILSVVDTSKEVSRIETANTEGDEISYIVKEFKNKLTRNEELESELKLRMLLLNKAQTYALQAQINPHFLNNVMETVNWLSVDLLGDENKVSEILKPLSVLLSISADSEDYLIPIEEEMRHVNIYTYIASLIYGDKTNFTWNINPEIVEYKIVKFTLQPIIENAITHGIKPKRGKGTITIVGDFAEEGIRFTIKDDGVGIEETLLASIREELADENIHKKAHLGLNNVNQRLKLVFGAHYGIAVDRCPDGGTVIEIRIPKVI